MYIRRCKDFAYMPMSHMAAASLNTLQLLIGLKANSRS